LAGVRRRRANSTRVPGEFQQSTYPALRRSHASGVGFDGGDITSASKHPEKIAARSDRIETPLAAVELLTANRAMHPRDQCGHFSC